MGDACTRGCRFCAIEMRTPEPLDTCEPARVAEAARRMGLSHVVVTAVTRDDLTDGGAAHFVAVIAALRDALPGATVEVLTSDFGGRMASVDTVTDARPDVFNHNLETVPRLYADVRPGAEYGRSLEVLARVKQRCGETGAPPLSTKSGLMLGLGETTAEVVDVMRDLREAGCDLLTLGQYLRPSPAHLPVADFIAPAVFEELEREGRAQGFAAVASAPFVRSSYHAKELAASASKPDEPGFEQPDSQVTDRPRNR
jgi:lipoic acid synthetase